MDKKAVALGYNADDFAPKILAKGKNKIAEQIIEIARDYGIPIREDENLTSALFELNIDDYIPEELFVIVAEILAFIYRTRLEK